MMIKELHAGVQIGGEEISILLYADNIVLISGSAKKMHEHLNVMSDWCDKWHMSINVKKARLYMYAILRNLGRQNDCIAAINC